MTTTPPQIELSPVAADSPKPGSEISIRSRLTHSLFLAGGLVLLITSLTFCAEEYLSFGRSSIQQLEILSRVVANNSTAALAFDNVEDATAVLGAFRADPHIVAAALYDAQGRLFARYPQGAAGARYPLSPGADGFEFSRSALSGFQTVADGGRRLGALYVESDLGVLYARGKRFAAIVLLVVGLSLPLAY